MNIYRRNGKEFSMRPYIKVLHKGQTHVFVQVLTPKCWDLSYTETTIKMKEFEENYVKVDNYNKDFYGE